MSVNITINTIITMYVSYVSPVDSHVEYSATAKVSASGRFLWYRVANPYPIGLGF